MKKSSASPASIDNVASFRLRRHHLLQESPADPVTICRDICGVQAQVMSAAYLQLWARNHALTRGQIEDALWRKRTLIKTSLMRQTLHLVPADEFELYITALQPCRVAQALRVMARFGISRDEAESVTPLIMDALSSGPQPRSAIAAAIRAKSSRRVHRWMDLCWGHVRIPVAEGLVCYGSGEGNEVNFVRTDQWLAGSKQARAKPKRSARPLTPLAAQHALLRKYLRAYGPASIHDFAHWAGLSMQEVKLLQPLPADEMVEIPGGKRTLFLLREDESALKNQPANETSLRLLPLFDPYLLAHREKDHLLAAQHYKRVYRNQGWISPVVLIDGAVAAVWSYKLPGNTLQITVEPFAKFSKSNRDQIAHEAEDLAKFFNRDLNLNFA